MPKPVKNVTDMEIDEVSLVDKGANQHAMVTIAKRAPEEETMPDLYDESGAVVDQDSLQHGQVVFDADGQAYEYSEEEDLDGQEEELEDGQELGKSAFFQSPQRTSTFGAQVMEELSKAYSDEDRDAVLSKAFGVIEEMEQRQAQFEQIAKSERDLRLTREYISKAAEYNLPIAAEELGPVLYRMAESMSYDDCAVIAKALETSGALFDEVGYTGGGDNDDVMSQVNAFAAENVEIGKSINSGDIMDVFDNNPQAYDEYLAQRGR